MRVRVSALCAMAAVALAVSPVAHADPHDDDFVNNLAGQGITGDPAKLIQAAHMVCTTATEAGAAVPAGLGRLLPMGYVVSSLHLGMGQATNFTNAAQTAYCPGPGAPPPPAPDAQPAGAPVPADAPPPAGTVQPVAASPAPAAPTPPVALPAIGGFPGMDRLSSALGGAGLMP